VCPSSSARSAVGSTDGDILMNQYCGAISLIALIAATSSFADGAGSALPTGGTITSGQGSIESGSNHLAITQHTNVMNTSWSSFDIGVNARVSISQPSASSTLIGRISGGRPSSIDGTLTANGRVVLINANGIHFGTNSRVDVGGIVASSLNLSSYGENAASLLFEGGSGAAVRQDGVIKSDYVALIGKRVEQVGRIEATSGDAALLAGDRVEISIGGNGLISAKVDADIGAGSVEASGSIKTESGDVLIKAEAASDLLSKAIHGDQTQSLVFKDGRLVLVNATGKMTADNIAIDAGDAGAAVVSGELNTSKTEEGVGGDIEVLGGAVHLKDSATLNASGAAGGGTIQVGGSWQNSDPLVRQSLTTRVDSGAELIADALRGGDGGEVVVWSDVRSSNSSTSVAGTLSASARGVSGSGGRIETSGFSLVTEGISVEASSVRGASGTWLLDPYNITISSATSNASATGGTYTATGGSATINVSDIATALASGTSVTISTAGAGSDAGDILWNGSLDVSLNSSVSLILQAHGDITIDEKIEANSAGSGALNVTLNTNFGGGADSNVVVNDYILTNGGDITIGGGSDGDGSGYVVGTGHAVELSQSIRSYGGDITIRGKSTTTSGSYAGVFVDSQQIYADAGQIAMYGQFASYEGSGLRFDIDRDISTSGWDPDVGVPLGVDDEAARSVLYSSSATDNAVYLYGASTVGANWGGDAQVSINFNYVGDMLTNIGGLANTPPIFASGGGNVVLETAELTAYSGSKIRITNGVYVNGGEYHLITPDGFAAHSFDGGSTTTIGLSKLDGGYSYYLGTTGDPKTIIRTDASTLGFSTRSAGDLSIYGYTDPDVLSSDYSVAFIVNGTADVSADIVLYEPISNLRLTGNDVRLRRMMADNIQVVADNIYVNDYDTSYDSNGNKCATNSGGSLSACRSEFGSVVSPVSSAYLRATSSIQDSQTNIFASDARMYVGELILESPYIDLRHGGFTYSQTFEYHEIDSIAVRGTSNAIFISNAKALEIGTLSAVAIDPSLSSSLTQTVSGISVSDRLVIETASGNLTVSAPISSSGTGSGTKDHYQDGSVSVPLTEFFNLGNWMAGGPIVSLSETQYTQNPGSYWRHGDYFDYPVILNAGFEDSGHTGGSLVFETGHAITMAAGTRALLFTGGVDETVGIAGYVGDGQSRYGARKSNLYQPNTSTASSIQGLAQFDSTYVGIYREQPTVTVAATSAAQTVVYGGTIDTTSSISGLVGLDTEATILSGSVAYAISGATSTSGNYVVGDHALSLSGLSNSVGYAVSHTGGSITITAKPVTVSYSSSAKTYDGEVTATVSETITGLVAGDLVTTQETAAFDSSDVAYASGSVTAQTISISPAQLTGADSANYSLATTSYSSSAQINPKTVTVSGTRAYDGTATFSAGDLSVTTGITGQSLTLSGTAAANATSVASASYLSDVSSLTLVDGTGGTAANYVLSTGQDNLVSVTARTVGLSFSRTYNGKLAASWSDFTVATGVSGEGLTISGAGTLDSSNVSMVTGLSSYGSLALADGAGGAAANYTLPSISAVSASLTPYQITGAPNAVTRDYDGTSDAPSGATLSYTATSVLASDFSVSYAYTGGSFDSANVASASQFTYTGGAISSASYPTPGDDKIDETPLASDFSISSSAAVSGTITAHELTADNLSFYVRDAGGTHATYTNLDDTDAVFANLFGSDSLLFDDSGLSGSSDVTGSSGVLYIKASSLSDATLTNADGTANANYELNTTGVSGASIYTVDAARTQLKIVTLDGTNPYQQVYDADTALDADFTNNDNGYWGIYDVTNDQLLSSSAFVASNGIINGPGNGSILDENVSFTATLASADASDTASVNLTGAYFSDANYKSAFDFMNEFVDSTGNIQVLRRPIVVDSSGTLGEETSGESPAVVITKYYDGTSDVGSLLGLREAVDQSYDMFINGSSVATSITAGIIEGDDATFNSTPTMAARAYTSDYTATEVVNSTYNSSVVDDASGRDGSVIETAAWVSVSGDALLSGASAGNYDIVYDYGSGSIVSDQTIDGTTYENALRIRLMIAPRPVSLSATRAYDGSSGFTLPDISVATGVTGEALTLSQTTYNTSELQAARALVPFINEVPLAPSDDGYNKQVNDLLIAAANVLGSTPPRELAVSTIVSTKRIYDSLTTFAYGAITNDGDGTYTAVQDKTSSSVILSVTGPHELVASGSETLNNYCLSHCFTISGDVANGFTLSRGSTTTLTNSSLATVTVLDITAAADITAKSVSITPTSGLQKLVGDSDPTFTYTATGVLDGETLSGALSRASGETAGAYAYTVGTLASLNTNYSFSLTSETFEIYSSVPLTLSGFTLLNKLYDGSASGALSLVSSWGTLAGAFSGSDQSTVALDTSSATLTFGQVDVGSDLSVTVANLGLTGTNSSAYSVANFTTTADINARPISLTASGVSKTYGDADPTLAVTAVAATGATGLASTDTLADVTGTLTRASGENVGSYDVALGSGSKAGNYSITFDTDNNALTIGQRAITLSATSVSKVYGDSDPTLAATVTSGSLGSSTVSDVLADVTGTLTRASGENVGSYDVALGSGSKAGNYSITFDTDNNALTIGQRAITLSATSVSKVYGDSDPTLAATVTSGSLGSSTVSDVLADVTGTLTRASGENVGSYDVLLGSGTATANYDISFVSDNNALSITPRPLTATGSVSGKTYQLGKENRLAEPVGARPLLISTSDEALTALPAVQRPLPPTDEEIQNSRNTQVSQGEITQEAQTQAASEIDVVQEAGNAAPSATEDQLIAQIQQPLSTQNIVFTLRDARSVSLESLMLSSNELLIISVTETSTISSIKRADLIEIEEEEEVEVPLSEVFPAVSLSDDINVAISFTNGNIPQWVRVNRVSQSVSIRPPIGVEGLQTLRLGVADVAGNMAATSLRVRVSSRNALADRSTNDQASINQPIINLARSTVQDLPGFLSVQALRPRRFNAGSRFVFEIPNGTFVHDNSGEPLRYVATLADGSPLPSWMTFDPETQTFSGEAPDGTATQLDVIVKAIDSASQKAQVQLRIEVE